MGFTPEIVTQRAEMYENRQPLATVEREHLDLLPSTFAGGDFGWREAEWVVQWYYRRFLGSYPDDERRAAEAEFGENSYEAVRDAIVGAVEADDLVPKLDLLVNLTGVDRSIASGFLQFIEPSRYVVGGPMEWAVLIEADELDVEYPDPFTTEAYSRYLEACEAIARRCDCDLWTVYRAIWTSWYQNSDGRAVEL